MKWNGLCLSPKVLSQPEMLIITSPVCPDYEKIAAAIIWKNPERVTSLDPSIIIESNEWPSSSTASRYIDETLTDLVDPQKIKDSLNPRLGNKFSKVGSLAPEVISRVRMEIVCSTHTKKAVKEYLIT